MVEFLYESRADELNRKVTCAIIQAEKTNLPEDWKLVAEFEQELSIHAETQEERETAKRGATEALKKAGITQKEE